jgi:hypothetical protein
LEGVDDPRAFGRLSLLANDTSLASYSASLGAPHKCRGFLFDPRRGGLAIFNKQENPTGGDASRVSLSLGPLADCDNASDAAWIQPAIGSGVPRFEQC